MIHIYKEKEVPIRIRVGNAWPVIEHRLGAPDAIIDAFTDGNNSIDGDIIGEACTRLSRVLEKPPHEASISRVEAEVLADCLEGSTYFADWEDHVFFDKIDPNKVKKELRAAKDLAKKLSSILGRNVVLSEA